MIMGDPNVTVRLNVDFFEHREALRKMAKKCVVFTGPIDAYYASQGLPKLEYRSLRFVEEYHAAPPGGFYQPCLQLNYPGPEVEHTRIVEYKHKPNQPRRAREQPGTVIFKEYSCDPRRTVLPGAQSGESRTVRKVSRDGVQGTGRRLRRTSRVVQVL